MSFFGLPAALFFWGGFLRGGEFTKNGPFDPSISAFDPSWSSPANLLSFRVFIKWSKTDPLSQGCCPTTFTSGDLVLVLFFSFKMASLFPGFGYCHFCNPPFRLLAFPGSFLATALELELPLLPLRKASLIMSSRRWLAGRVMRTCSMCTPQWRPSLQSQQVFPNRYEFHLFLGQGCPWISGIIWGSGCWHPWAPLSPVISAQRSSGLAWELMAGLPGFASQWEQSHLGAGGQEWKLPDLWGTQHPFSNAEHC